MPLKCKKCHDTGIVTSWERTEPFNPASPTQVKTLFHHLGIRIPMKRGENRETVEAKYVHRLSKRYPSFRGILDVRKRNKLISDYLWVPGADSTIRTQFGFWPSTWRKSSRSPNLQIIPRPSDVSDLPGLVRETLDAPEGYMLIEADSEGIEAVLVGYDAGSPRMLKLAKCGIHGYFESHVLGCPIDWQLPHAELKRQCKAMKKRDGDLYDVCKRTIHGPLTPEHEVLTSGGWVSIATYNGTPVAQWAPDGSIRFAPAGLYERDFIGDLVTLEGRSVSVAMTPDHGVPVYNSTGRLGRIAAESLPNTGRLPLVGLAEGTSWLSPNLIRMMVAVQADGTIYKDGHIVFHLYKRRKLIRLLQIAKGAGFNPNVHPQKVGYTIYFPAVQVRQLCELFDGYKLFRLSLLLSLVPELREVFIDELPHWDGVRAAGRSGRNTAYLTCVRHNADVVQAVAAVTNRQALLREKPPTGFRKQPMYQVSFNRRKQARLECLERGHRPYCGKVYCIANTATGWVLIRHNGKVSIQSNTHYGLTSYGMADEYEEVYSPKPGMKEKTAKAVAERYQNSYLQLVPEFVAWRERTRQQAYTQRYLDNHFEYRHYFYEVFAWDSKRNEYVLGADGKRCIAFKPQSDGSACQSEYILRMCDLAEAGDERYQRLLGWLSLLIHDSLVFCVPLSESSWAPQAIADVMNMQLPELGGLRIGVEVKAGQNMKDQSVVAVTLAEEEEVAA